VKVCARQRVKQGQPYLIYYKLDGSITYSTVYTRKRYSGMPCYSGHLIHEIKDNRKLNKFEHGSGWSGTNRAPFESYPDKTYVVFQPK